ncbi:MAG: DNA repair protein RecO [Candidatus Sericytochromatia bacterium]
MSTYLTQAITLKTYPVGEHDKILVLFSREHGLRRVMAKGARRAQSRLGGRSEPLCHNEWLLARGKRMDVVAQCETVTAHRALRTDFDRLMAAMYVAEATGALIDELQPYPEVFDALSAMLTCLAQTDSVALATLWYELRLLDLLGYRPELDACVHCEAELAASCGFHPELGGGLCDACSPMLRGMRLMPGTLAVMRRLQAIEAPAQGMQVTEALLANARAAMREAIACRTETRLKTVDVLSRL